MWHADPVLVPKSYWKVVSSIHEYYITVTSWLIEQILLVCCNTHCYHLQLNDEYYRWIIEIKFLFQFLLSSMSCYTFIKSYLELQAEILWRRHMDRNSVNIADIARKATKALARNIASTNCSCGSTP